MPTATLLRLVHSVSVVEMESVLEILQSRHTESFETIRVAATELRAQTARDT